MLGPIDDDHRAICGYSPPSGARCEEPAVVHILVSVDGGVAQAYATCPGHSAIARCDGVVQEHPHRGWCGFPSTRWDEGANECVLDDGGVELPAREAVATA